MKFLRRLFFYGIGVGLGLLITYFMFGERSDIKCTYLPNDRVLNELRGKKLDVQGVPELGCNGIDTAVLRKTILWEADVDFNNSPEIKEDSCRTYWVEFTWQEKSTRLALRNCAHRVEAIGQEGLLPCP